VSDRFILTEDELTRIRRALDEHRWYRTALEKFRARVDELIARSPAIPLDKGRAFFESCVIDNSRLVFDPYEPHRHACPKCGRDHTGETFDLAWVRQFQEWFSKRLVEAGILYALLNDERYPRLVRDSLLHFATHYRDYPLANNLLGPTRLFQSTYLEAFWLVDMVAAYDLTRDSPSYSDHDHAAVRELFYESSTLIRSFDEGLSNRQAFNNAGMGAVGFLYQDPELIEHVLAGPHGFSFHMSQSLLEDGVWYEGENYHFATLDHTLDLAEFALHRDVDLYHGTSDYGSLRPMFDGPLKVMLPDLTFPSRKDSWFGRGVAYHRDSYELGYARYGDVRYGGLLANAYQHGADRSDLSWRTLLYLAPELPVVAGGRGRVDARSDEVPVVDFADLREKESQRMPGTGVAVLRRDAGATYAGLEYGHYGGGHGHPDRLHLTLFANGVHWLADPGTGWYHVPELGWYRSTIAHNTLSVDGQLQNPREGRLLAFGEAGGYQAAQALVEGVAEGVHMRRTLLLGDGFLVDVLDATGVVGSDHTFDWAFHTRGQLISSERSDSGERSRPAPDIPRSPLGDRNGYEFLTEVQPLSTEGLHVVVEHDGASLRVLQTGSGLRHRATVPGVPLRESEPLTAVVTRKHGGWARFATLWVWAEVDDVTFSEEMPEGVDRSLEPGTVERAGGILRVAIAGRVRRVLVDDAGGVAVVSYVPGAVDLASSENAKNPVSGVAWFGRNASHFPGSADFVELTVDSDRKLAGAALTRSGTRWVADLPSDFGAITLSGLGEGGVDGLSGGAEVKQLRSARALQLLQPPKRAVWLETGDVIKLFAGVTTELTVMVASYGLSYLEPVLSAPHDWRVTDGYGVDANDPTGHADVDRPPTGSRSAHIQRRRLRIEVPDLAGESEGELSFHCAEKTYSFPYRVASPITTAWRIESLNGEPGVVLALGDLSGNGGEAHIRWRAPWRGASDSTGSFPAATHEDGATTVVTVAISPSGTATARLKLPDREPSAPLAADGSLSAASAEEGRAPFELPGFTYSAGEFEVEALVTFGRFKGVTRARLPLYWSRHASKQDAPSRPIRLDREDQALWADRRWRGPSDASAAAEVRWDKGGMRLSCRVTDDKHVADANEDDLYENDSIQVYFDFRSAHHGDRNFDEGVAAYVLAPSTTKDSVRVSPIAGNREISNRGARAAWFTAEGVEAKATSIPNGYRVEAYFPYTSLGTRPLRAGDVIGFDLSLSDNDGTWYRNTQLLWSGARGRRCYIRGSYHDPREYGWLIVAGDGVDRG